ncbi:pro-corazonin-like [Bombus huntii]|uniref:pro-corazonin-like n=1 Tax=Bombus huntii TaxID=85661 RepID=UPI0021A9C3B0|nr:pro-corazonin-like [Bombus huntii]
MREFPYIKQPARIMVHSILNLQYCALRGASGVCQTLGRCIRAFKMGNARVLILFILSLTVMTVTCQSYHFSIPDWTNEKTSIFKEIVNAINKYISQSNNVLANCELQKLKLLLQGNINYQLFQVPCDLLVSGKKSFSENTITDYFHRQLTPVNNNY